MSIQITGVLQKQAWIEMSMPPIEQVRPGVWSVPVSIRDNPVRYTLSYLIANSVGDCIVVDPGFDSEEGWKQLLDGLALAGLSLDSVIGVVSTHFHYDHLGMVRRLVEATGAWVGMHRVESDNLGERQNITDALAHDHSWLTQCSVPAERVDALMLTEAVVESTAQLARPTRLLEHDDLLPLPGRELRVLATPGHTAGHICIVDMESEVILTGDHVLPRISPNVGLGPNSGARNALAEYLASLDLMLEWNAFEVCPAHEYRFLGLATRATDLKQHHADRSQEIIAVLSDMPGSSVWEIAERLSWSRGWASLDGMNLRNALSETLAHVEHLTSTGRLFREARGDSEHAGWLVSPVKDFEESAIRS